MQKFISPILFRVIGVMLIIVGIVAAYYGPLELFMFYLFSEGGRFYYEGLGVGSYGFAALVVQDIGYYVIAAIFLPVGIGYVKLRRWSVTLTQLYAWFWLGAGILLVGNGFLLIPSIFKLDLERNVLLFQLAAVGLSSLILLIILPVLALWFYKTERVKAVFKEHDPNRVYWMEKYPFRLLALLLLFVIMIIMLHITIFFQSLFPMFGKIMLGRPAVYLVALCVLILEILIYGTVRLKKWAWWGSLAFISLLTVSSGWTFSRYTFYDIVLMMNLPIFEMEIIDKMLLLHNFHLVALMAVPLLAALGLIISSKPYFWKASMPVPGRV